jgi:hypothetical protein
MRIYVREFRDRTLASPIGSRVSCSTSLPFFLSDGYSFSPPLLLCFSSRSKSREEQGLPGSNGWKKWLEHMNCFACYRRGSNRYKMHVRVLLLVGFPWDSNTAPVAKMCLFCWTETDSFLIDWVLFSAVQLSSFGWSLKYLFPNWKTDVC